MKNPDQNPTLSSAAPQFVLNQPVPMEEDAVTEFKEVTSKDPVSTITDTAENYAVGFLNASGGRLLWGIRDKARYVIGVPLDDIARDRLRKNIAACLHNIQPAFDPSQWQLTLHPVDGQPFPTRLFVVELMVKAQNRSEPFYNHRGEAYIRLNGVNQRLAGPRLTAWILNRAHSDVRADVPINDPKLLALAARVRRIFTEHGLEPAHLTRFLQISKAPFQISLTDTHSDAAFVHWLDDAKMDWMAQMFLVRREWIDGEDDRIHHEFDFDKQPEKFFSVVNQHADALVYDEVQALPEIHFLRRGIGKDWERKGSGDVFVVVAIPIARFSNERTIYKYISDLTPYPWTDYARTYIQLRAWARLTNFYKSFYCFGREIPIRIGEQLESNAIFLREVLEKHTHRTRDDWHPEDYAVSAKESHAAKDVDAFPEVIEFLHRHNLPSERSR